MQVASTVSFIDLESLLVIRWLHQLSCNRLKNSISMVQSQPTSQAVLSFLAKVHIHLYDYLSHTLSQTILFSPCCRKPLAQGRLVANPPGYDISTSSHNESLPRQIPGTHSMIAVIICLICYLSFLQSYLLFLFFFRQPGWRTCTSKGRVSHLTNSRQHFSIISGEFSAQPHWGCM